MGLVEFLTVFVEVQVLVLLHFSLLRYFLRLRVQVRIFCVWW